MRSNISPSSLRSLLKNDYLILLIVVLGLVLRIYDLGGESLWLDEFYSVNIAKLGLTDMLRELRFENESNPPLHFILLHYFIALFGDSEFAVRLPSALFGTFSILMIYMIGKRLFNRETGLIAALILAVSVFQVNFSQEARGYNLMMFLGLFSLYSFLRIIDSRHRGYSITYILSSALLMYTHYYGVFVVAAENIYFFSLLLLSCKTGELTLKRWLQFQFVLLVLFLPEVVYMKDASALQKGFWLTVPGLSVLSDTFSTYSGPQTLFVLYTVFAVLALFIIVSSAFNNGLANRLYSSGYLQPAKFKIMNAYFLLVLLVSVIVIPYVISTIFIPIYYVRYTMVASAAFYLLAALGIDFIRSTKLKLLLVGLIIVVSGYALTRYYVNDWKPGWRNVISDIDENAAAGDVVAIYPFFETGNTEYYSKRDDLDVRRLFELSELDFNLNGGRLWLIVTEREYPSFDSYEDVLTERYEIVTDRQYSQLRLYELKDKAGD